MILSVNHLSKSYGEQTLFKEASFLINDREKAAIVGLNGTGKTTLLRLIFGEEKADSGEIYVARGIRVGYLRQINDIHSDESLLTEMEKVIAPILEMEERIALLSEKMKHQEGESLEATLEEYHRLTIVYEQADGLQAKSRAVGILKGLGFREEEFVQPVRTLSGGQKTRLFLARLLLEAPDLILLDEPTNHLDLAGIEWLEGYIQSYKGAVVIVSHDRYFLDKTVEKVIDLHEGTVTMYTGTYSTFSGKKAAQREAALKAYLNQQREIRHQEAVIEKLRSFNREKSIRRAESREKLLNKIERLEKPREKKSDMQLFFSPAVLSGKDVLTVEGLAKAFDGKQLFSDLSFRLKRGEHTALIGGNGTGKTTILKLINGLQMPDEGEISYGTGVQIGYYDQEHQNLERNNTVFEEMHGAFPHMTHTQVRNLLASFLFFEEDIHKKISSLSGGERERLSLAKLMLGKANLLILDEPTNHLDMASKEILEAAIANFGGTVLYVSHDRYFINQTATRILSLEEQGLTGYLGNYDYYLEKRRESSLLSSDRPHQPAGDSHSKSIWKSQKEEQARRKKLSRQVEDCESQIRRLEEALAGIESRFHVPENQKDAALLMELQREKEELEKRLESEYSLWETAAHDLEQMEKEMEETK